MPDAVLLAQKLILYRLYFCTNYKNGISAYIKRNIYAGKVTSEDIKIILIREHLWTEDMNFTNQTGSCFVKR